MRMTILLCLSLLMGVGVFIPPIVTPRPKRDQVSKLKNHIAIVLDRSGSMYSIKNETIKVFNSLVREIRDRAGATGQETSITLVTFSNNARLEYFNADVKTLKALGDSDFQPAGMTALLDGVGTAIDSLANVPGANDENTSFLVMVVTDGDENNSSRYSPSTIVSKLKQTQSTDRWSFVFQVPPGTKSWFCPKFGIPTDNVREWEATKQGMEAVERSTTVGLTSYFTARSAGKKSVTSFYVDADLSKVTTKQVKTKLDDISDRFRVISVPAEESVKEFVEAKTGKPYVIGSAYYQLSKKEKVQPGKQVLVMEKGKKAVWGGDDARQLIGLPTDGVSHAVVNPLNLGQWEVYIKSTSVNRKLVRGTKLLLDKTKVAGDTPTWDHEAVAQGTN